MNARRLGISLAIGWVILPFVACAGAFLVLLALDDELGITAIAVSATLSLPFIVGTTVYTWIAATRCAALPRTRVLPRLLLFLPLLGLAGWAILANATPRRITPETVSHCPFDRYWYSAPQTAYGSPSPFLRFFDKAVPDRGCPEIGATLFDVSSLLSNLTIWSFPVFLTVSLAYALLPARCDEKDGRAIHTHAHAQE